MDKVQDHARVREVIFVGLVMALTNYPIVSHRIDHDVQVN